MMTRAELLEQLSTERYVNTWWTTPESANSGLSTCDLLMVIHEARLAELAASWETRSRPTLRAVS